MTTRSHTLTVFNNQQSFIIPRQQLRGLFVSLQTHSPPPSIATAARSLPRRPPLPVCGFVTREARTGIEPALQDDYSRAPSAA